MEKIYSEINPDVLLHTINRKEEIISQRQDLSPKNEYLQVACFSADKGKQLKSHKHLEQKRTTDITQESWLIIEGSIKISLYDIDHKLVKETTLNKGDCLVTFRGGHKYTVLEDGTVIYEHKTGPYQGKEKDYVPLE